MSHSVDDEHDVINAEYKTFRLITFGCKVNQYETDLLRAQCIRAGLMETRDTAGADLVIINTCGVTAKAVGKSRRAARAALRRNPAACVVATGCAVDLDRPDFEAIENLRTVPHAEKDTILGCTPGGVMPECRRRRALLKIQDGCNQFCTYCVVPHVRSILWSKPLDETLNEARYLISKGHAEIVLTGVRLGLYDGGGEGSLPRLLSALEDVEGLARVRFSSIEINEVSDALLDAMARSTKFCPHLHMSLQSGDDTVLARMNRPYDSNGYLKRLGEIRSVLGRVAITTDVIAGFPGETVGQFRNTLRACREAAFSKIHIFPFSARHPAPAAAMAEQAPPGEVKRRTGVLAVLERELAMDYRAGMLGDIVEVLVERRVDGVLEGKTRDYVDVGFEGDDSLIGEIVYLRITDVGSRRLRGVRVSPDEA